MTFLEAFALLLTFAAVGAGGAHWGVRASLSWVGRDPPPNRKGWRKINGTWFPNRIADLMDVRHRERERLQILAHGAQHPDVRAARILGEHMSPAEADSVWQKLQRVACVAQQPESRRRRQRILPLVDAACERCGDDRCPGRDYPDRCIRRPCAPSIPDEHRFVAGGADR